MSDSTNDLFNKLGEIGEAQVRQNLASGIYGPKKIPLVQEWLRRQEEDRSLAQSSKENRRQDDTLKIARSSRNAAWFAVFCALLAVIITSVTAYNNLRLKHLHLAPNIKSVFSFPQKFPQDGAANLTIVNTEDIPAVSITIELKTYTFNIKTGDIGLSSESYGTFDKKWVYIDKLNPHDHQKTNIKYLNVAYMTNKEVVGIYVFDLKYYREADMKEYEKRELFFVESGTAYTHKEYRGNLNYKNIMSTSKSIDLIKSEKEG